jgi:hypothetical protein
MIVDVDFVRSDGTIRKARTWVPGWTLAMNISSWQSRSRETSDSTSLG